MRLVKSDVVKPFGLLIALACSCLLSLPAHAMDWADLWSSAEQRALKTYEQQAFDTLINEAPDASWRGLAEYGKGDFAAAAKSFAEQRELAMQNGQNEARNRASYNQANALLRNQQYDEAIELYDAVISDNPEHDNAIHNRDIAQQLRELQQQQQQGQQESGGENQEQNESDQDQSNGEQQDNQSGEGESSESEPENNANDQSAGEQDQQQDGQSADSSSSDNAESNQSKSEQSQAEEEAEAAKAMQAEQQREAGELNDMTAEASQGTEAEIKPLTEREQANEQWLRQIPDDPAGLLERKIQNRHLTDFPKVKDGNEPW